MISGCNAFFAKNGVDPAGPQAGSAVEAHYRQMADRLTELAGDLEEGVHAAIVGFDAGGPPAVQCGKDGSFAYTCELSIRDDQVPSVEGMNYEIGVIDPPNLEFSRSVLRQLGGYFLTHPIGHDHRVSLDDVAGTGPLSGVLLRLELGLPGYTMYFLKRDETDATTSGRAQ